MCCLLVILAFLGPRAGILFWWLLDPDRWDRAFDNFWAPLFGAIFLPWTTIMFVAVAPFGNIEGLDWMWLAFAAFVDVLSLFGQFGGSRNRMPGYDRY